MQLVMFIGNDMIESVPLQEERLSIPGYLGQIKRALKSKHSLLIRESSTAPDFLVVALSPAVAKKR